MITDQTLILLSGLAGLVCGTILPRNIMALSEPSGSANASPPPLWLQYGLPIVLGAAFTGVAWSVLVLDTQAIPEVQNTEKGYAIRLFYHLTLFGLLVLCVGTDFRDYVIPDQATFAGTAIGIFVAFRFTDVQLIHLWVDWSQEVPGVSGPYIPGWFAEHPHWHGLLISLAGALCGGGVTWLVRSVTSFISGQESMGFGDVTLMAMAGAFIGWQPVLIALMLAPLVGIPLAILTRLCTSKTWMPFGPPLAAAVGIVVVCWRPIWRLEFPLTESDQFSLRHLFGDGVALLILGGIGLAGLIALMTMLRLYRSIPVQMRPAAVPDVESETDSEQDQPQEEGREVLPRGADPGNESQQADERSTPEQGPRKPADTSESTDADDE